MIVCICRNINEFTIDKDIKSGYNIKRLVQKYDCTSCKKCLPTIKEMVDKYKKEC